MSGWGNDVAVFLALCDHGAKDKMSHLFFFSFLSFFSPFVFFGGGRKEF